MGEKQEGQVSTLGEGAGDRISSSLPDPAGPGNVGLENVTLNSSPFPQPFPAGETYSWTAPLPPAALSP
jgi:hypothetical protein